MKEYLLLVASILIFSSIFEGVLPSGRFGNRVKTVISMVVVLVILNPIISIFNSNYDFNKKFNSDDFNKYLIEYQSRTLENEITSTLKLEGYTVIDVNSTISNDKNKVEIFIKKDEFLSEIEHIDSLEKAKQLVVERFYLSGWEVVVV